MKPAEMSAVDMLMQYKYHILAGMLLLGLALMMLGQGGGNVVDITPKGAVKTYQPQNGDQPGVPKPVEVLNEIKKGGFFSVFWAAMTVANVLVISMVTNRNALSMDVLIMAIGASTGQYMLMG